MALCWVCVSERAAACVRSPINNLISQRFLVFRRIFPEPVQISDAPNRHIAHAPRHRVARSPGQVPALLCTLLYCIAARRRPSTTRAAPTNTYKYVCLLSTHFVTKNMDSRVLGMPPRMPRLARLTRIHLSAAWIKYGLFFRTHSKVGNLSIIVLVVRGALSRVYIYHSSSIYDERAAASLVSSVSISHEYCCTNYRDICSHKLYGKTAGAARKVSLPSEVHHGPSNMLLVYWSKLSP